MSYSDWENVQKLADAAWEEYRAAWAPKAEYFNRLVPYPEKKLWYAQFYKRATAHYIEINSPYL